MNNYAATTEVPVEKSRAELERTLARYGATHFGYMTSPGNAVIQFLCKTKAVRFYLPLPAVSDFATVERRGKTYARDPVDQLKVWEQSCRRSWRALNLVVKAKLEAVESGITSFEEEFLAHFVMPNGQTFGQFALPQVEQALERKEMPAMLALPHKPSR